ncbi:MAG: dTDP-glucose 4,6-dehydratase [Tatlockia sp.]|nr:dTDP-glucose 4,6-dehydratase [Tatlockia sp.]
MILVTGGFGFIGSNFVLDWLKKENEPIINLDLLTYAGNPQNLASIRKDKRHIIVQGNILDKSLIETLLKQYNPRAIINFAAETHVDRSIHHPEHFIKTNIEGTFCLLEASRAYWENLKPEEKRKFRFLQISTDEVFGSLSAKASPFTEQSLYAPNSPYSASKAAGDHLVRAWHHTYGLPVLTTHCSNNYGPFQFPEKLIPLIINNALAGKTLPLYGDGQNIRDWLYAGDHCSAVVEVLTHGKEGSTYNIGGDNEKTNLQIVTTICQILDELRPDPRGPYSRLIQFVKDRPGHDHRYAIDASKIKQELDWRPVESFNTGIRKTISWYLENQRWLSDVKTGSYREWITKQYDENIGINQ